MALILPKQDAEGNYYISYSQVKAWTETKGFSTGQLGKIEYIRKYFFNEKFPDKTGFAQFGTEVENYITTRTDADKFTLQERKVLDTIEPLGVFQKEIKLQFKDFYVLMYIDDKRADYSKLRDYKTASEKSSQKYYGEEYNQLDIYALGAKQECGKVPQELEVCVIERLGNGFKGGRNVMTVGERIWYIPRKTDEHRLLMLEKLIKKTVSEISEYYDVFLTLNNK